MKIKNEREAKATIKAVSLWLQKESVLGKGSYPEGSKSNIARKFATQLLESAKCNGVGGCLLCQA